MRKKLGELLVEAGAVSEEQVRNALGRQRAFGQAQPLGRILVSMGLVSPAAVARALATQFDMPFVELPQVPPALRALVSVDFQAEHRVIPFRLEGEGRNERLLVAVEDPADLTMVDELRFQLRRNIRVCVAAADDIDGALGLTRAGRLDEPEPITLEEEVGEAMDLEHGSPARVDAERFDAPTPVPLPAVTPVTPGALLEWELPEELPALSPALATPPGASADLLEELLAPESPPSEPSASEASRPRVPVVLFGGAAQGVAPPPAPPAPPEFSEADLQVLDSLERLAHGQEVPLDSEKVRPARMVAALIRLLIKKRVIQEHEFLEELARK